MLGQRLNLIILLGLGLLLQACSKPSHVEGAPRFTLSHITKQGDGSGLSVDRRSTRTWKDYDGDGLTDRKDPDIDDDGVPNLADQYPFDENKFGDDKNDNGIADFIDLNYHPTMSSLAPLQLEIKERLGVVVMNGSDDFTMEEIQQLHATLFNEVLVMKMRYSELKVVVRYSKDDQLGESRAEFDPLWQQMSFFPNADHDGNILAFNASLVHELGHVHAAENPGDFKAFAAVFEKWQSPSLYGATSPEEGYAENFLFELYKTGAVEIDAGRFNN